MKHLGPIIAQYNNLKVILCSECGFRHLDPIPDASLYANGIYHSQIKPSMESDYAEDHDWWNAIYYDWLWLVERYAPSKTLLDVGAGTGEFVRFARGAGWLAYGIEVDKRMADRHNLFYGNYRDYLGVWKRGEYSLWAKREINGVGVISAHWLMEHLPDPVDFLSWAHDTLSKNGILLFTIPNDFSDIQHKAMLAIGRPYYWLHETHINYWNATSIREWLPRHGFRIIDSKTYGSWQPERNLLLGQNYLEDYALGRQLHNNRKERELKMTSRDRRRHMLANGLMGVGRDLSFVAVKK